LGEAGAGETGGTRSRILLVAINAVSVCFLVLSLRDVKLAALGNDLATMNWWWVAVAVVANIASYGWQAWRWSLLLHPVEPVSFWQSVRAIYVGLFTNEVLPFHAGEVVRCYLVSRWTQLPFSVSLSSALIERIFDGIWLCLCFVLTLRIIPIPHHMHWLVDGGYILGAFVLAATALLALAMFRRPHTAAALSADLTGFSWKRHARVLIDDLSLIGHSRYLYFAFFQSLPYLLLQVIPIYAAFQGYGFDSLELKDAFALMVILRVGSVVPQAPANLGLFQFLTIEILRRIYHVGRGDAEDFSLVLWAIVTLPLLIGGLVALTVTGARIGELRRAAHVEQVELAKSRE
jgi:uncharacterized protein (TIRG00374 family)